MFPTSNVDRALHRLPVTCCRCTHKHVSNQACFIYVSGARHGACADGFVCAVLTLCVPVLRYVLHLAVYTVRVAEHAALSPQVSLRLWLLVGR